MRPVDRPAHVPLEEGADLSPLDTAKIFEAPEHPGDRPAWRAALARWRDQARPVPAPRYPAWTRGCFAVCVAWLWDEALYDAERGVFTPEEFLRHGVREFGGYDAVVLWHAYPMIGLDERDQFRFYRDVPGIADLVAALRRRGVRVLLDYNPWAAGGEPHAEALAALVAGLGADGVFLDTMREGGPALRDALGTGVALESESAVPLTGVESHAMSWAQWFGDSATPGVLRTKWFERRHMLHHTRRWHRDHSAELHSAWMNGCGVLVWENVFGSWVGWSARDRALLRAMLPVQRRFAELFRSGEWTPLADEAAPGLAASRWSDGDTTLWTVVNRADRPYEGPLLSTGPGVTCHDAVTGARLGPGAYGRIPARGVAAVVTAPGGAPPRWSDDTGFPARPLVRIPPPVAYGDPGKAVHLTAGPRELTITHRVRECGFDDGAPYVDAWKPLPPDLHALRTVRRRVDLRPVAVAEREVTNAEYETFVRASGYAPRHPERFLDPARDTRPDAAVTCVDLDDARAYAAWAGLRLPTEYEWQAAAGTATVWNWTESEHADGRTRFVFLKGGTERAVTGSEWYADDGVRTPEHTLKLLRAHPGVERSAAIGFRCAADLEES
jgi:sulfatase-modifying factor enzyme 1